MKKTYKKQLYTLENGEDIFIDVVVEDGNVIEVIAGEDIEYKDYSFKQGDLINVAGDESLIRSEDIEVSFLEEN